MRYNIKKKYFINMDKSKVGEGSKSFYIFDIEKNFLAEEKVNL